MQDGNGYYAPIQYNPGWIWLGVFIIALIVAWYVFVWWFARRRNRPPKAAPPVDPRLTAQNLRNKYFELINEIERAHAEGQITRRTAHQKLGTLVRFYVHEASGVPAQVMTLDDLTRANLRSLADAVASYYPAEFASIEQGDVPASAHRAKEVVATWH